LSKKAIIIKIKIYRPEILILILILLILLLLLLLLSVTTERPSDASCLSVVSSSNNNKRSKYLTKSASRGAHSPIRGHPRGSKVVPLNSWGRGSY